MTDYTELVKALRSASTVSTAWEKLMRDAAAAIEALQAEVERLQAQFPKRGEWITIRLNNGGSYTGCSCCEAPIPTDTMLDYIPERESKYCYSCGAKMIGEENVE